MVDPNVIELLKKIKANGGGNFDALVVLVVLMCGIYLCLMFSKR
jgi:hypothetical protein